MSEFLAAIFGSPEARDGKYPPGSFHVHNCRMAHGPDPEIYERATVAELYPQREQALAIMFESRLPFRPTQAAVTSPALQSGYDRNWDALKIMYDRWG